MKKHSYFDLFLPDFSDLNCFLDSPASTRTVLSEWPLSCVETLTSETGAKYILKSVRAPCTQELSFYQLVESCHTPRVTPIYKEKHHASFLYKYQNGKHPEELALSPERYHQMTQDIHSWISNLPTTLPAYLDLSTSPNWNKWTKEYLHNFLDFLNLAEVSDCDQNDYLLSEKIINDPALMEFALNNIGYAHGDFSQDNVLILPDGNFFILDWQRSLITSPLVDYVAFFESLDIEPLLFLPAEAVILTNLLNISWLLDCAQKWFLPGRRTYDHQIKQLVSRIQKLS